MIRSIVYFVSLFLSERMKISPSKHSHLATTPQFPQNSNPKTNQFSTDLNSELLAAGFV